MKFFVVSDIHGFYDELIKALNKAGFDKDNENHWLIVCGDCFDRGKQPLQVMNYLKSLPRKVLVRGNHEDLLEQCCYRGDYGLHDVSNGTYSTICELGDAGSGYTFAECCANTLKLTHSFRESMVNYFETKNYIFVHGWIPCEKFTGEATKPWWQMKTFEYNPNWRECNDVEWASARWINGIDRGLDGIIEPNKIIVCGHWHCSYGYVVTGQADYEYNPGATWEPFRADGFIAIDRCTAHTKEVNVLVVEDDFLE